MKRIFYAFLCFSIFLLALTPQTETLTEYQVRAAYLYNFLKFVKWPKSTFENESQPITIGLFRYNPIEEDLRNMIHERTIDSRSIIIKIFNDPKDVKECHVIYFGNIERRHQISTINNIQGKPILTISDADYFCRIGGMIHFFIEDKRLGLMINRKALDKAQLEISSKLLRVAKIVDES